MSSTTTTTTIRRSARIASKKINLDNPSNKIIKCSKSTTKLVRMITTIVEMLNDEENVHIRKMYIQDLLEVFEHEDAKQMFYELPDIKEAVKLMIFRLRRDRYSCNEITSILNWIWYIHFE